MKHTIIIASAFRATNTNVENAHDSILANNLFNKMTKDGVIHHAVGSWKEEGEATASTELSFVGVVPECNIDKALHLFLQRFNQDAVLAVNPETMAAGLFSLNGNVVQYTDIGTMQQITEEEAKASECYTYWQGVYWLAK